ncbi:MAG: PTS system fructose-specific EIIABC component [Lentisphaerae bacterium ADurb.BinA184]|nr:MAG: PTS system fructose-specific EIIABC component [Lentisphaerae bacterium ADurb.BinA184]
MAHWAVGKLIAVFDDEGFYVQQLHRRQDLFHLRKGRVAITLARDGGRLLFTSDANVATFVRTAVYDVLGELQGTIRGLQEPVDAMSVVGQIVPDRQAGPGPHLRLQDFVRPELLKPRLEATNKTDVIRELLGLLEEQDLVRDPAAALEALLAREASMSTGLQHGIAIPHARTNAVDKLVCAIGLKPAGLNFEALDGQPSRIFILTLSPQDAPVPHVQFISGISQALTEERRRRLLACRSADQMYIELTGSPVTARPAKPEGAAAGRRSGERISLTERIQPSLVKPRLAASNREDAIAELLGLLVAKGLVTNGNEVRDAILLREHAIPTGLARGIAVPHARTSSVRDLVCAIGLSPLGLDFEAADGKPANIVILTLSPPDPRVPHIQFMAAVLNAVEMADREELMNAKTPADVIRILTASEAKG